MKQKKKKNEKEGKPNHYQLALNAVNFVSISLILPVSLYVRQEQYIFYSYKISDDCSKYLQHYVGVHITVKETVKLQ